MQAATAYGPSLPRLAPAPSAALILAAALVDLGLAVIIIMAGSQGVYRFAPPLFLWVAIYGAVALKLALFLPSQLKVMRDNIAIFAFPAVAFLSASWSILPGHSLYSAAQLTITYLAGFWLGWRYRPHQIALVVVLALAPLVALSLVNWATGAFGEVYSYNGGLLGIFGNKNTLGRMSLLLGLCGMALLLGGRRRPGRDLALSAIVAMAALALLLSQSASSALVFVAATALLLTLSLPNLRAAVRLLILGGMVLAVLAILVTMALSDFDPAAEVLAAFGKSSSLTGRTFLWQLAREEIALQPWFGVGFDAYWESGAFAAADRIQMIFGEGLISFHNFVLDIWVGLGLPGLVAIAVTLGAIAQVYGRYFARTRSTVAALMLAVLTAGIGVALFNPLLHAQHGNMIVILIAFAVSARIELGRNGRTESGGDADADR